MRRTTDQCTADQARLAAMVFELQRERTALTSAIMQLREPGGLPRARAVLRVLVALLRLERANRGAVAAIGIDERC